MSLHRTVRTCIDRTCTVCKIQRVKSIREQLHDRWRQSDLTLEQIIDAADLGIVPSSLSRQMSGRVPMPLDTAETIARVLGIKLRLAKS